MIDLARLRTTLEQILRDELDLPVYPRGVDGQVELPAIAFGQPDVEFNTGPCDTDTITLPIAVAVAHDGISEQSTQRTLEDLWMRAAGVLRRHIDGPDLGGIGVVRTMPTAEPGDWTVQGTPHPAYVLTLKIHG